MAKLGQPGWSQIYSVSDSSRPSRVSRPVFIVTAGMGSPPTASSLLLCNELGIFARLSSGFRTRYFGRRIGRKTVRWRDAQVGLLSPVPFIKDPAPISSHVAGRYPNDTGAWRTHPLSSYPHISITIPTLISANPNVSSARRVADYTDSNRRGWSDANHGLRNSDSRRKQRQKDHPNNMHLRSPLKAPFSLGNH